MGNYLDFALKIAHRGNTGSHKGKRKLACLSENYICALLLFFSVFGLENAYGYGRALAVWLIDKGYLVKDVNTAISHRQAKHRGAMYRKSDSDDVEAIALATLNMLDKLPNACPNDAY